MRTAEREARPGRLLQAAANAAVAGAVTTCGDRRTTGSTTWVCVCPPHAGPQPAVDDVRRRRGESVHADRHVYVAVPA